MARLATPLSVIGAMFPFEIGDLFRELPDDLAVFVKGVGEEGMARGAELRATYVLSLFGQESGGGPHDVLPAFVHIVGTDSSAGSNLYP
jgi:hypothetical protein